MLFSVLFIAVQRDNRFLFKIKGWNIGMNRSILRISKSGYPQNFSIIKCNNLPLRHYGFADMKAMIVIHGRDDGATAGRKSPAASVLFIAVQGDDVLFQFTEGWNIKMDRTDRFNQALH